MKIKKLLLPAAKAPHVNNLIGIDTHALEGWAVGDWRYDETPHVFETNEPAIEEMIDAWRQQKTIFTIEAFFVG